MCRLRQGFAEMHLAHLFKISQSTVSRIFISWINFMYLKLGQINIWPSRKVVDESMPEAFKEKYPSSVQPENWLILQRNFYTSIAFGLTEHHELNNSSYLFAILILLWGLLHINSSNSWCGLAVRYIMPNPRLFLKMVIVYCR